MVETAIETPQLLGESERRLADARDYSDLHLVMRAQAEALEVSRATINDVCGLQNGYAEKLLAPSPIKRLGALTFGPMLRTLGLKLVVYTDPAAIAALAHRMPKRDAVHARNGAPVELPPSVEEMTQALVKIRMSENGRRGGHARATSLPAKHRARIARKAARARWDHRATASGAARKIST